MAEVILARGDDWSGMYIDGVLVYEDHRLYPDSVVKALVEFTVDSFRQGDVDLEWLDEQGSLPVDIDEVKWKIAP